MKIKRYLWAFAAVLMLVSGCGDSEPSVPGKVERINTAVVAEKIKNEEDFAIVLTQTSCGHCQTFHTMLTDYLPDHNVTLYEVELDWVNDKEGTQVALKELEAIFPDFNGTPDLYYLEKGKIKSRFWDEKEYQGEGLSESSFHQWAQEYNLIK